MLSQIHFVLHFGSLCHISCGGYIRFQVIPEEKDVLLKNTITTVSPVLPNTFLDK